MPERKNPFRRALESARSARREQQEMLHLLREQNTILREELGKLVWEAQTARKVQYRALVHAAVSPMVQDVRSFADERQLGFLETVEVLRDEQLSFVRFGDGEFRFMLRLEHNQGFQQNSESLSRDLRQVIDEVNAPGVLLGFPFVFHDMHWNGVWADIWGDVKPLVERWDRVGVAHVTRPIYFQVTGQAGVAAWRSVWDGANVTIVTGKDSRFDLIPELFDNLGTVDYVHSKPVGAYDDLDRLVGEVASRTSDLVLIALGPTGTLLTSRLAALGRRAIDIGHISDSYEHIHKGGTYPESKALTS